MRVVDEITTADNGCCCYPLGLQQVHHCPLILFMCPFCDKLVNFLLNRPPTTPIDLDDQPTIVQSLSDLSVVEATAYENRDELRQLHHTYRGLGNLVSLAKAALLPEVFFAFDYGIEGERYRFDTDHDF